jgi:hypothetical protein
MARNHPRFLFSSPHNTKNTGPFIIHTLPPITMFKVDWGIFPSFNLTIIPWGDTETSSAMTSTTILNEASKWLNAQLYDKAITHGT